MNDKFILDACCGPRMMWFNKHHPNVLYIDIREEEKGFVDNRDNREIKPDMIMDNRKLDFPDKTFKLIVMDPPHIIGTPNIRCRMTQTFGCLNAETWQDDLKRGFNECWRVLEDYGVFILKWNDCNKNIKEIVEVLGKEPLFAQKTSQNFSDSKRKSKTYWMCFMKIPELKQMLVEK
jgi:hypothetical protein